MSLRVGVRGSGQLASSYLKQWEGSGQNSTALDIDYGLSGGLFVPYLIVTVAFPDYKIILLIAGMTCAHGTSLLEDTQLECSIGIKPGCVG